MPARSDVTREELEAFLGGPDAPTRAAAAARFGINTTTVTRILGVSASGQLGRVDMRVYDAVVAYIDEHHWSPSIRDLAESVGTSGSTVHLALARLEEAGYIETGGGPRMIRVVNR